MLKIKTFPRIHITLIGMNREGYRINGGIGFSMASPTLNLRFEPAGEISVLDKRSQGFSKNELTRLDNHLNKVMKDEHLAEGFHCVIEDSQIHSHFGFGTSTMVYLSCVEALLIINKREYTNDDVVNLSGRGGTSGIGINTYFNSRSRHLTRDSYERQAASSVVPSCEASPSAALHCDTVPCENLFPPGPP